MTPKNSLFNRGYTASIILVTCGSILIMTYFYGELIFTLINSLVIKNIPHGLVHVE